MLPWSRCLSRKLVIGGDHADIRLGPVRTLPPRSIPAGRAQAGLYHFYGVPKYDLPAKMFGVFRHSLREPFVPIFRGFDDEFFVPHSRHTEIRREDIMKVPELTLLSESEESGVYMAMARGGREFFITGHSEYSPYTLNDEYMRDLGNGLPINKPRNYYRNNDPGARPGGTLAGAREPAIHQLAELLRIPRDPVPPGRY